VWFVQAGLVKVTFFLVPNGARENYYGSVSLARTWSGLVRYGEVSFLLFLTEQGEISSVGKDLLIIIVTYFY